MSTSNKIDDLPSLRETVEAHNLWANKAFGQNFLFDLNVTRKIARAAGDMPQTTIFEIGPGPGGLTRALLLDTNAPHIIAIEKDKRFIEALQPLIDVSDKRLQVIEGDALKVDLLALAPAPRAVIANLPYNVGTELLIGWLHSSWEFSQFILMFQKEVAERLVAKVGTKAYGRLSVLAQSVCEIDLVMKLPPSAFTPAPKVTSSVVRLRPRANAKDIPVKSLEILTAAAFGQRRKMLRQSMKEFVPLLEAENINTELRAENLTVQDYLRLAQRIHKL